MATTAEINQTHETLLIPAQDSEIPQKKKISLFKGQIILNPSITKLNFFCFVLFTIYQDVITIPTDLLQASVLGVVYKLNQDAVINIATIVQFSQLALQLLTASLFGYLCDKYGRKILIFFGLMFLCVTIFLTPNFPSPYPYYIINQSVQTVSSTALGITPLLADYIDTRTQGRVSALTTLLISAGSFVVTSLSTVEQDTAENIHKKFFIIGVAASGFALWIIFGIKGGSSYYKETPETIQEEAPTANEIQDTLARIEPNAQDQQEVPQVQLEESEPGLMAGIKEGKNPWVFTGYVVYFLVTSSSGLISFILVTYVIHLTNDETKANLAYSLVSQLSLSSFLCSIFFGAIADKVNKFKLIILLILCSIASITLLILVKSPTDLMATVSMILFGVASSGFTIFGQQLLSQYSSPQFRGSVFAFASILSLGGTAMINVLGVYLLRWNILLPFLICLGTSIIGLIILLILFIREKNTLNKK